MQNQTKILFIAAISLIAAPILAGCAENTGTDGDAGGDAMTLKLGTLMPLTGALSNLGQGMQNGAKLAIKEVNDADAGITIEAFHEDDKTTDTAAITNTFNLLVSKGVTAIAGPCCSGITGSVLDLAVQNEVVVSSPSATSPALTERDNKGYFWRVSPTDEGQGRVLAQLVADENVTTVNIIAVNNDYGSGLAAIFKDSFETSLSGKVVTTSKYDEGATEFSSQVTEACTGAGTAVQGVVLVAYTDDAASILKAMQAQDCLSKMKLFASEGIFSPDGAVVTKAGKDADGMFLAKGMKGTTPQAPGARFGDRYMTAYGEAPVQYAAESYDAVAYVVLGAVKAKSTDGAAIQAALLDIANAPGEKCNDLVSCIKLLNDGKDIDYVGMAHDLEFTAKHEPASGAYSYWAVTDDGKMEIYAENIVAK